MLRAVLSDFQPAEARRAFLWEGLCLVGQGVLYPFGYLPARHRPVRRADQRTLVFVHGLAANRSGFYPLQVFLRLRGFKRQLAVNYRSSGSIESIALRLKRQLDCKIKGGRIDLIAHSMGGLVARFYVQQLGGARRVDRLITLGTPHHGTHASILIPSALVDQLRPGGPLVRHLNQLPPPRGVRVTSIGGGRDLTMMPPESAFCSFGEQRMFRDLGHLSLLFAPAVFREISATLES